MGTATVPVLSDLIPEYGERVRKTTWRNPSTGDKEKVTAELTGLHRNVEGCWDHDPVLGMVVTCLSTGSLTLPAGFAPMSEQVTDRPTERYMPGWRGGLLREPSPYLAVDLFTEQDWVTVDQVVNLLDLGGDRLAHDVYELSQAFLDVSDHKVSTTTRDDMVESIGVRLHDVLLDMATAYGIPAPATAPTAMQVEEEAAVDPVLVAHQGILTDDVRQRNGL